MLCFINSLILNIYVEILNLFTDYFYLYLWTKNTVLTQHFALGTIVNWLHAMGFNVTESKKGIYFDGHERYVLFCLNYNNLLSGEIIKLSR